MDFVNMTDETICGHLVTAGKKRVFAVYLDLMKEFDRLCKAAGVTYWVFFGTLLGTVRHQGFIPWDDDVDIMIPREDYDRLWHMTSEQFGAKAPYFLQNPVTDPLYAQFHMRFRRSDTTSITGTSLEYVRRHPGQKTYNMGLNLSLWPLDNAPSPAIFSLRRKISYLLWGIKFRAGDDFGEKPLQHRICKTVYAMIGPHRMIRLLHRSLIWRKKGPMVQCMDGLYPDRHYWHAEDFQSTLMLPFENLSVPVPGGYDRLLTERYGNWRQFPPPGQRTDKHGGYLDADTPYDQFIARFPAQPAQESKA